MAKDFVLAKLNEVVFVFRWLASIQIQFQFPEAESKQSEQANRIQFSNIATTLRTRMKLWAKRSAVVSAAPYGDCLPLSRPYVAPTFPLGGNLPACSVKSRNIFRGVNLISLDK